MEGESPSSVDASAVVDQIREIQQELRTKKTFLGAAQKLVALCENDQVSSPEVETAVEEAGKLAFKVLQTRFSSIRFWQAGLELFLCLEFALPSLKEAAVWRQAAMDEVDDEARERYQQQLQKQQMEWDKKHNQGKWSDANTPVTLQELMMAQGVILVNGEDGRPGMSRQAQDELRIVTVLEDDVCVVCQEAMPAGCKAKAMPCGHKFHDDCLSGWINKSNSCPVCRFDELPSEKRHYDEDVRRVERQDVGRTGIYA
mmetsp:Transcript_27871/g.64756  ORF Transcript_27871/g.64756 Transcript_27871/m.64756 type:complete len:257 (-) Transcript_27871:111-881(-)